MLLYKDKKVKSKEELLRNARLPKEMKEAIAPYVTTSSRYNKGRFYGLQGGPSGGFSMRADKNGFFIYICGSEGDKCTCSRRRMAGLSMGVVMRVPSVTSPRVLPSRQHRRERRRIPLT